MPEFSKIPPVLTKIRELVHLNAIDTLREYLLQHPPSEDGCDGTLCLRTVSAVNILDLMELLLEFGAQIYCDRQHISALHVCYGANLGTLFLLREGILDDRFNTLNDKDLGRPACTLFTKNPIHRARIKRVKELSIEYDRLTENLAQAAGQPSGLYHAHLLLGDFYHRSFPAEAWPSGKYHEDEFKTELFYQKKAHTYYQESKRIYDGLSEQYQCPQATVECLARLKACETRLTELQDMIGRCVRGIFTVERAPEEVVLCIDKPPEPSGLRQRLVATQGVEAEEVKVEWVENGPPVAALAEQASLEVELAPTGFFGRWWHSIFSTRSAETPVRRASDDSNGSHETVTETRPLLDTQPGRSI